MNRMINKKYVKEQYQTDDNLTFRKNFHEKYSTSKISYHDWIFHQIDIQAGMKILDVGCGKGDFWKDRIDHLPEVELTISDFSEHMVSLMTDMFKNVKVTVKQLDVASLPYDDSTFDVIIATSMLYHVPNLAKALEEISRVLKPGGKLYAATYGERGFGQLIFQSLRLIDPNGKKEFNVNFSLDNGKEKMQDYFEKIFIHRFPDRLLVTDTKDYMRFLASMTSSEDISSRDEELIFNFLNDYINDDGVLEIEKNYGMFEVVK